MIVNNVKDIGNLIRVTRKTQKLTQRELAAASGVGIRFIVDLEAGKETISLWKTLKVAAMLGLKVEFKVD